MYSNKKIKTLPFAILVSKENKEKYYTKNQHMLKKCDKIIFAHVFGSLDRYLHKQNVEKITQEKEP